MMKLVTMQPHGGESFVDTDTSAARKLVRQQPSKLISS
jgi:hypothetical protein